MGKLQTFMGKLCFDILITVTENYGYFHVLQLCFGYDRLWVIAKLRIKHFFQIMTGKLWAFFIQITDSLPLDNLITDYGTV